MSQFICLTAAWLVAAETDERAEIITAFLAEFPFSQFESQANWLKAYANKQDIDDSLQSIIQKRIGDFCDTMQWNVLEEENWNVLWEKHFFDPIEVGIFHIRAPFHPIAPQKYTEITIMPRMSFGTGHHETTRLMLQEMQQWPADFLGNKVLDMGSGTGILAIAASKLGASDVLAIEIDDWVVDNAKDNINANEVEGVRVLHGDACALVSINEGFFQVILANIHREVILADLSSYVRCLGSGAKLFLSGLQQGDVALVRAAAEASKLKYLKTEICGDWVLLLFEKSAV